MTAVRERLRAVLLDIDGTLVDSNEAHARAWHEVFARHGRTVAIDAIRDAIGKGGDKLLRELGRIDDESDEGQVMSEERKALFKARYLPRLQPLPGSREIVERLLEEGLLLAIATSASSAEVDGLLRVARVDDLVALRTTADDAERSKPDPDIVVAALGLLGVQADEAILLGDTPYDVAAAERAGSKAVAVRTGGWSPADLVPALAVYRDLPDLLTRFDDSPFAVRAGRRRAS
jgi:HAD superfamily hydrolase (TIGR01509 family)